MEKFLKLFFCSLIALVLGSFSSAIFAANQVVVLDVAGAIGPATQDYVHHGLAYARTQTAKLVILRLDTPGGLETSMRGINRDILASAVPVVTYVVPAGARAASAGTFILYASHVAAMAPGTNLGAASPVNIGEVSPTGAGKNEISGTMEKKVSNDAAAYIRSLAELRGRNVAWGEQAVRAAVSLSAEEALKLKVIDVIANNIPELLQKINGRTVLVQANMQTLQTANLSIEELKPDWRFEFLAVITNPNVAYILLLIGIYGLFFEFYNPGFVLPGVAGAIALLLALYALQLLPINYAGFALLLLGIALMISEAFISSFGVLGIGGVIAFVAGSIFLFDVHAPGFNVAWQLILMMSLITAGVFLIMINLALSSMRRKIVSGREALIGMTGEVLDYNGKQAQVRIQGEIWNAASDYDLQSGQQICVTKISGLLLTVEPVVKKL